jgi:hypothetical protein
MLPRVTLLKSWETLKPMKPRPMTNAARTTAPLIKAWDFFIFLSRSVAAGGRPGTVVAKSDML